MTEKYKITYKVKIGCKKFESDSFVKVITEVLPYLTNDRIVGELNIIKVATLKK